MAVYISQINMPDDGNTLVLQIFPNGEVHDEHGIRLGIGNWAEAIPAPEHGRWDNIIQGIIPSGQCSNCGAWDKVTRFCPNCGSQMEGGT